MHERTLLDGYRYTMGDREHVSLVGRYWVYWHYQTPKGSDGGRHPCNRPEAESIFATTGTEETIPLDMDCQEHPALARIAAYQEGRTES